MVKEDWLPDGLVDVIGRIVAVMEVDGTSNVATTGIPVSKLAFSVALTTEPPFVAVSVPPLIVGELVQETV